MWIRSEWRWNASGSRRFSTQIRAANSPVPSLLANCGIMACKSAWTDEDVARFIEQRGIKCAPLYYDEEGVFHVERRLGCIGCPLAADNGLADYKQYPKLLKQVIKAKLKFYESHPKAGKTFDRNAYNSLYFQFFCRNLDDYRTLITGRLFPENAVNTKQFLEDYFQIDL